MYNRNLIYYQSVIKPGGREHNLPVGGEEAKEDAQGLQIGEVNVLILWHEPPVILQHALKRRPAQWNHCTGNLMLSDSYRMHPQPDLERFQQHALKGNLLLEAT